jgi:hypothetical protein
MKCFLFFLLSVLSWAANAAVVFQQAPSASGGIHKSSWYSPDGLDGDEYAWDGFTLTSDAAISEIHWRGGYTNYLSGAGTSPVYAFSVSIYRSIGGGSQPDMGTGGKLVTYRTSSSAGETPTGTAGGVAMYDYAITLATPFQATAGVKYWVQIEASQGVTPNFGWPPDWGLCTGTGGDGSYFRRITGGPFQVIGSDLAFSLYTSGAATVSISASVSPANSGTVAGAGSYPINSTASLTASAATGWGFASWTQNGTQVSTNPHYTFTANANRTLVANFVHAYAVTVAASPSYAGSVSRGGVYNSGSQITVTAAARPGFVFSRWTDYGSPVSTDLSYTFTVSADHSLMAVFDVDPLAATYSFDDARQYGPFPIDLSSNGLWAHFSGTGSSYSIQAVGTVGLAPAGFSGLCVFPSSVFPADLTVDFSETLKYFSIMYAPQELACDTSATMRVNAYLNGSFVGTATATAPVPGTYPTGTLAISLPSGFNSVIVHYDSRPPTCADWGPIFLADNVVVIRVCSGIAIAQQPADAATCASQSATFSVVPVGAGPFVYRWRHGGVALSDGPGGVGVASISGSATPTLIISPGAAGTLSQTDAGSYDCLISAAGACQVTSQAAMLSVIDPPQIISQPASMATCPSGVAELRLEVFGSEPLGYQWRHDTFAIDPLLNPSAATAVLSIASSVASDEGSYDCVISNACGDVISSAATITVCIGDFNCDGGVDGADVESFFTVWEQGQAQADVNLDGGVDGGDIEYFFVRWAAGC